MTTATWDEVEAVVSRDLRPALAIHGGSIRVESVREDHIGLSLVASCHACYFRKGCVANLVVPTLQEHFGERVDVEVRGVPVRVRDGHD